LPIGSQILGTIQAYNLVGPSTSSTLNTVGAVVIGAPQTAITNLASGSSTGPSVVELTWDVVTSQDSGGSPVDYQVWWDQGSSGTTWSMM